jgi:hypothetical protein
MIRDIIDAFIEDPIGFTTTFTVLTLYFIFYFIPISLIAGLPWEK